MSDDAIAIPPLLAERLAELDRFIEANETVIGEAEAQIKAAWLSLEKYRLAKAEVENAIALCRRAWCAPPWEAPPPELQTEAPPTLPEQPPPRQRRDMREVVRQILKRLPGLTLASIVKEASDERIVRESEIRRALERLRGEVQQDPETKGWRLAVGPAGAVIRDHQTIEDDQEALLDAVADSQALLEKIPPSLGDTGEGDGSSPPPTDDEILDHIVQAGARGVVRDDAHAFAARNRAGLRYLLMTNRVEMTERGYRAVEAG